MILKEGKGILRIEGTELKPGLNVVPSNNIGRTWLYFVNDDKTVLVVRFWDVDKPDSYTWSLENAE